MIIVRRIGRYALVSILLLVCAPACAHAHTVMLKKDLKENMPRKDFDCRDTIYADVGWNGLTPGPHTLRASWIGPDGRERDSTSVAVGTGDHDSWVWLKMSGSTGSGLARIFSESKGYANVIGAWVVRLFIDDKFFDEKAFTVSC